MKLLRSIIISFSLYSIIPMPVFVWNEEEMKHAISFLPLVGIVIGAISIGIAKIGIFLKLPALFISLILSVVPLILNGGFHFDGFMDVEDAKHSYKSKEEKLKIMKDPHIGAFAVIRAIVVIILWIAFIYLILERNTTENNFKNIYLVGLSFGNVRAFCALTSILYPRAKKDGMLNMETKKSGTFDIVLLSGFIVVLCALGVLIKWKTAFLSIMVNIVFALYYKKMCEKQFGGVTGDTAGYFVVVGELLQAVVMALF